MPTLFPSCFSSVRLEMTLTPLQHGLGGSSSAVAQDAIASSQEGENEFSSSPRHAVHGASPPCSPPCITVAAGAHLTRLLEHLLLLERFASLRLFPSSPLHLASTEHTSPDGSTAPPRGALCRRGPARWDGHKEARGSSRKAGGKEGGRGESTRSMRAGVKRGAAKKIKKVSTRAGPTKDGQGAAVDVLNFSLPSFSRRRWESRYPSKASRLRTPSFSRPICSLRHRNLPQLAPATASSCHSSSSPRTPPDFPPRRTAAV